VPSIADVFVRLRVDQKVFTEDVHTAVNEVVTEESASMREQGKVAGREMAGGVSEGAKEHVATEGKKAGAEAGGEFGKSLGETMASASMAVFGAEGVFELFKDGVKEARTEGWAPLQQAAKDARIEWSKFRPEVEDTGAKMAKLGFTQGEVNAGMLRLVTSTGSSETAIKAMSVAADLARYKHIDLAQASDTLARAASGNTRALAQLGISASALPKHFKSTGDAASRTEEVMGLMEKRIGGQATAYIGTFGGKMDALHAQLANTSATAASQLLPAFSALAGMLTNTLLPAFTKVIGYITNDVGPVIARMYDWLKGTSMPAKILSSILIGLAATIGTVVVAMKIWEAATKAFTAVQEALDVVLMADPLVLVAVAIAALVVGFVILYKRSKEFRDFIQTALQDISKWFFDAWHAIDRDLIQPLVNFFTKTIPHVFGDVLTFLKTWGPLLLTFIIGPFGAAVVWMVLHWSQTQKWLTAAWNAFLGVVKTVWNAISGAVMLIWNKLWAAAQAAWDVIKTFFHDEWTGWVRIVQALWQAVSDAIMLIWHALMDVDKGIGWLWSHLKQWFHDEWTGWLNILHTLWSAITGAVMWEWNGFVNGIKGSWNTLAGWFSTVWNTFKTTASAAWGLIVGAISTVWTGIKDVIEAPMKIIVKYVWNPFASVVNKVHDFLGTPTLPTVSMTGWQTGGRVGGGYGGGDVVPALLEPGEAVVDKVTTTRNASTLARWGVPGFQLGGIVHFAKSVVGGALHGAEAAGHWATENVPGLSTLVGLIHSASELIGPIRSAVETLVALPAKLAQTDKMKFNIPEKEMKKILSGAVHYVTSHIESMFSGGSGALGGSYGGGQALLNYFLSKQGHPYSQTLGRYGPTYFDCSGLLYTAARAAGIPLPQSSSVAASEADWFASYDGDKFIRTQAQLMAGDIVFQRGADPGPSRFGGIGHVGMAMGPNRQVSALGTAYGVTQSNIGGFVVGVRLPPPPSFTGVAGATTMAHGVLPANWKYITDFLVAHGYSPWAAAGIAGNIMAESGGNPESTEIGGGGGQGLIQWTGTWPGPGPSPITGNIARDLFTQMNAILTYNRQRGPGAMAQLMRSTSPKLAADAYLYLFEAPRDPSQSIGLRESSANAVAAAMHLPGYMRGGKVRHYQFGGPIPEPVVGLGPSGTNYTFEAGEWVLNTQGGGGDVIMELRKLRATMEQVPGKVAAGVTKAMNAPSSALAQAARLGAR